MKAKKFEILQQTSTREVEVLADLAARTFKSAYEPKLKGQVLDNFVASTFSPKRMLEEMNDPNCAFLIAYEDEVAIGYAMLRTADPPPEMAWPKPVELVRIYLDENAIGKGYGAALMRACLEMAAENGNETIWLGVWEENSRAIRFYQKWGFTVAGSQKFDFGDEKQTDLLMVRSVQ